MAAGRTGLAARLAASLATLALLAAAGPGHAAIAEARTPLVLPGGGKGTVLSLGRVAALPMPPQIAQAEPPAGAVRVLAEAGPDFARLDLEWPGPVVVEMAVDGRELLLRFDRELRADGLDRVAQVLGNWVESVGQGYDTLLLRANRAVAFDMVAEGGLVSVELRLSTAAEQVAESPEQVAEKARLALLQARLKSQMGLLFEARRTAREVAAAYGPSAESEALRGEIARRLGNWQAAAEHYDEALRLAPDNPGIVSAKASLLRERGPQLRTDVERQVVEGGDTQHAVRTTGRTVLAERTYTDLVTETRWIRTFDFRRPAGMVDLVHTGRRSRGTLTITQDFDEEAMSLGLSLHTADDVLGGGFKLESRDAGLANTLSLDIRRPYWDLVEGLLSAGRRTRAEAMQRRTLSADERLTGLAGTSLNRYGLRGDEDVATTWGARGELAYTVSFERPFVQLGYAVDGEYVMGRETRRAPDGTLYSPLAITQREVHSALASLGGNLLDYVRAQGFIAYSYDRYNFQGPQWGGELAWEPVADFEVTARYLSSTTSGRGTQGRFELYGLSATTRF